VLLLSVQQDSLHDNQTESTKGVEREGREKGKKPSTTQVKSNQPLLDEDNQQHADQCNDGTTRQQKQLLLQQPVQQQATDDRCLNLTFRMRLLTLDVNGFTLILLAWK
jgi:hypothetical protein